MLLAGCGTKTGAKSDVEAADPTGSADALPACERPELSEALAVFAGRRCDWVLRRQGEAELSLRSLAPDAASPPIVGAFPQACTGGRCDFEGREVSLGPLVIAQQRSAASEMPSGVWLGFVAADGGLAFVDLWAEAGAAVVDQGTELGPAHALAPFDCDGKLGLQVAARFSGQDPSQAPDRLVTRAGLYGDAETIAPIAASTRCVPVRWRMP